MGMKERKEKDKKRERGTGRERKKERERVGEGWVRWEKGTEINTPKTRFSYTKLLRTFQNNKLFLFFFRK